MKIDETHEYVRANAKALGCCGNDEWRGHLCSYHQGFEDGMDEVLMGNHERYIP